MRYAKLAPNFNVQSARKLARQVPSSLRREIVQCSVHVPAPALTTKNVSASYGREIVRGFCQVRAPAIMLVTLAEGPLALANTFN